MKILVAMANHGSKNRAHAERLIREYRSMPYQVDIVVLCEAPKGFGTGVTEQVGLPTADPWSLPFGHKRLFVDNAENYDAFIYTEDDTLITERNIEAFLRASAALGGELLPGFLRYEAHPDGRRQYPDIHGPFHWMPETVRREGGYVHARLSNEHSACYILTREQLLKAIRSGGFDVPPHSGRYDLLCAAATDPYTQCGLTKVICISQMADFELHHLPNAYLHRFGLSADEHQTQIDALLAIEAGRLSPAQLFATEKLAATPAWDKSYYEAPRAEVLAAIPAHAKRILSVGCGSGATEGRLMAEGRQVTAIPLDSVIAQLAARHGTELLPPDFEQAFKQLAGRQFDAILVSDVLQHLPEPVGLLLQLQRHLSAEGVLIGSVPNLGPARRLVARWVLQAKKWAQVGDAFATTRLRATSSADARRWFRRSGFRSVAITYRAASKGGLQRYLPSRMTASDLLFSASRTAT